MPIDKEQNSKNRLSFRLLWHFFPSFSHALYLSVLLLWHIWWQGGNFWLVVAV